MECSVSVPCGDAVWAFGLDPDKTPSAMVDCTILGENFGGQLNPWLPLPPLVADLLDDFMAVDRRHPFRYHLSPPLIASRYS